MMEKQPAKIRMMHKNEIECVIEWVCVSVHKISSIFTEPVHGWLQRTQNS